LPEALQGQVERITYALYLTLKRFRQAAISGDHGKIVSFLSILNQDGGYMPQPPTGVQAGGLNPPDPVGIPWARIEPALISFLTFSHEHSGQTGSGSLDENTSDSKTWQHSLHWYSYIGIASPSEKTTRYYHNFYFNQVNSLFAADGYIVVISSDL
jgi:hypothetical protein